MSSEAKESDIRRKEISLPLRMTRVNKNERIIVGRFDDPVPIEFKQTSSFYMNEDLEEDIKEDEILDEDKTAELYQKRRRRRFKRKSLIVLEDSVKKYKDGTLGRKWKGTPSEVVNEGIAPSYVLFKMQKRETANGVESEVQVIPVNSIYQFRLFSRTKAITLAEVDMNFENKELMQRAALQKYKRISNALSQVAKASLNSSNTNANDSGDDVVMEAFGKAAAKKARKVSGKKVGHMDDGGVDLEAEQDLQEMFGVGLEYEEVRSDDEEDAVLEQADLEDKEERAVAVDAMGSDEEAEDSVDSEDENDGQGGDEEEDDEEEDEKKREIRNSTYQVRREVQRDREAQEAAAAAAAAQDDEDAESEGAAGVEGGRALKRGAEALRGGEGGANSSSRADKKMKLSEETVQEDELTEDGVRAYIQRQGGRIKIDALAKVGQRWMDR